MDLYLPKFSNVLKINAYYLSHKVIFTTLESYLTWSIVFDKFQMPVLF